MPTFLFDSTIFGPVKSRRLGYSLGINLLPNNDKLCNFNCVYCECGLNKKHTEKIILPTRNEIYIQLEAKLISIKENNEKLTAITYAGNGEPTMHPEFSEIMDDTVLLRNKYFSNVKIAVLSNATMLKSEKIFNALKKADKNILKLDSAFDKTLQLLNQPVGNITVEEISENLKKLNGDFILQTLFITGEINGVVIDNTSFEEINAWLKIVEEIHPEEVMIYTIERDTPYPGLKKVTPEKLHEISELVKTIGIKTLISQ